MFCHLLVSSTIRKSNMNRTDYYDQIIGELSSSKSMLKYAVDLMQARRISNMSDVNDIGKALQNVDKSLGSSINIVEKLSDGSP